MSDLKSRIQKASEWNDKRVAIDTLWGDNLNDDERPSTFIKGVRYQHSQMQWLVESLEIAVEALEHADKFFMDNGDHRGTTPHMKVAVPLNKIAALVPKGENE